MATFADTVTLRPRKSDEILWMPSEDIDPIVGTVSRVGRGWVDITWHESVWTWGQRFTLPLRDTFTVWRAS